MEGSGHASEVAHAARRHLVLGRGNSALVDEQSEFTSLGEIGWRGEPRQGSEAILAALPHPRNGDRKQRAAQTLAESVHAPRPAALLHRLQRGRRTHPDVVVKRRTGRKGRRAEPAGAAARTTRRQGAARGTCLATASSPRARQTRRPWRASCSPPPRVWPDDQVSRLGRIAPSGTVRASAGREVPPVVRASTQRRARSKSSPGRSVGSLSDAAGSGRPGCSHATDGCAADDVMSRLRAARRDGARVGSLGRGGLAPVQAAEGGGPRVGHRRGPGSRHTNR